MDDEMGKGLQMKSQDELMDVQEEIWKEHEEFDNLNSNFAERLEERRKRKGKAVDKGDKEEEDKDNLNKNKKRLVTTQKQREDSDSE
uniref:Uncharacterized protein n=1 Tax=Rhizophagus irregularis (strain DAOM 181602 / DAOM 197198 / MUCL 43194) TaxID=747089 RepID=U9TWZ7_RHIID